MKKLILYILITVFSISCSNDDVPTETEPKDDTEEPGGNEDPTVTSDLPDAELEPFEIAAYLPYWGLSNYYDYEYKHLTTIYILTTISYEGVMSEKGLIFGENDTSSNAYDQPAVKSMLSYIRDQNPDIKIVLALSDLHNSNEQRKATASLFNGINLSKTVNYLMKYYVDKFDFDGVAIDFEDSSLDMEYIGMNYPLLIKKLAQALHDESSRARKKICIATLNKDYNRSIITDDFINNVDLVEFMDYGQDKIDHITANQYRDLKVHAAEWAKKIPKSKLSLGVAGWSLYVNENGTFEGGDGHSYKDIIKQQPDNIGFIPYLTTSNFVAAGKPSTYHQQRYNSLYEIRRKAEWAKDEGYRGVFLWDITKDPVDIDYKDYAMLKMLYEWNENPDNFPKIVGYTTKDFYDSGQSISVGFHSLTPSVTNWVGVYNFETGESIGDYNFLANSSSGNLTISADVVNQLQSNKLYILKFYNGVNGAENEFLGTSHPFYRL